MKKIVLLTLSALIVSFAASAQHWSLTWKNFNVISPGLEQIGKVSTSTSRELANPRWSIGCECLDREYADFAQYKPYVGELGVGAARIQSGWARCEQKKGKYDFAWLDEVVDGLCEQGIRPWMCLAYGNPVYGAQKSLGSLIFTDENTMQAWKKYVTAVVNRYKGRVNEWEIWNEPNLRAADQSEAYASLLMNTADAIRKADPDATIIGGGLSRMPIDFTSRVLDIVKKNNKLDMIDYISFHPYYENPDDATSGIIALADLIATYDPRIKLFSGESGCPSVLEWAHALRYHEWTEYSQAKWVARRLANDFALGIRSSIFAIADNQYPNMQQSFGMLCTNLQKEVIYKRPSFHTMQHIVNLLHSGVKATGSPEYMANTAREIKTVGLSDTNDKPIGVMYWYSDRIPSDDLSWDKIELSIKGLSLNEPVLVDVITGKVYDITLPHGSRSGGRMKFTGCPIWDAPMMLIERSAVPFAGEVTKRQAGGSRK
ncbi:MAG: beta-galactosidase, partial [Muribaculaceae bacterium]|nr:beta-galactosidase [Muribaculaceae bacterium]